MEKPRSRGPSIAKDLNRKIIYNELKSCRSTTRVDLARKLKLNKNTVNSIVDELIETGYVNELGQKSVGGAGRKPMVIEFHAQNKWTLGVQIASDRVRGIVSDLYASPLHTFVEEMNHEHANAEQVVSLIVNKFKQITTKFPSHQCIGVTIGIPGVIDAPRGHLIQSSHLKWQDVPIGQMLLEALPSLPLQIDHSVKLASLGEWWHGQASGMQNFAYVNLSHGIGCSLFLAGQLIRGENNVAGELGHIIVQDEGPLCSCGHLGCLEAIASIPAIRARLVQKYNIALKPTESVAEWLLLGAKQNNEIALTELKMIGTAIGRALGSLVNLVNPKMIIFDGPLAITEIYLFPFIERELKQTTLPSIAKSIQFARSQLFPLTGCIGASVHSIQSWEQSIEGWEFAIQQHPPLSPLIKN